VHAQARPGVFRSPVAPLPFAAKDPDERWINHREEKTRMHTQNVNVKTAAQKPSERWGENPQRNITLSQELPPLRGMAVRVAWGMAQVMRVIDETRARYEEAEVLHEAEMEGYHDFYSGNPVPPGMFSDSSQLVKAWNKGWSFAAGASEMAECSGCHSGNGEPCPYHD